MAFAALYDANVLIPHKIRDVLMITASTRLHAVYWSEDIFAEWLHNSVKNRLAPEATVLRFQRIMNEMFPDALIAHARYARLIDSMTNEPGDRHVLAAAVIAEADVLVTSDTGDFPRESVEAFNLEVQTPDEFVRTQASLSPRLFLDVFLRRAETRNRLSIERGQGPLAPEDIALFLRDGPSRMPETGQYLLNLLNMTGMG